MCTIGKISKVKIISADNVSVVFQTDSKLTNFTTDIATQRVLGTYTVPAGAVFPLGPTVGAEHAVALTPGAVGPLYLDQYSIWSPGNAMNGVNNCMILGSLKPWTTGEQEIFMKWPKCGSLEKPVAVLTVRPTSVKVRGYVHPSLSLVDLELLDPRTALSHQSFTWDGSGPIDLRLTPRGCSILGVPHTGIVHVWPVQIWVDDEDGYVDLRDQECALNEQSISWQNPGEPIDITLKDTGFAQFGKVMPSLFAALAQVETMKPEQIEAVLRLQAFAIATEHWSERGLVLRSPVVPQVAYHHRY